MVSCGQHWQPTAVLRVVESIFSSTCVVRVVTDAGTGFLKGMGNPAGNESLALELVGSELAAALGLTVPPFAVIDVSEIDVPMAKGGSFAFGPGFISKEIRGAPGDPSGTFMKKLGNPRHVPMLIALDTWIRNQDRCPPPDCLDPAPKWDNLFFTPQRRRFEMVVLDHTHCFVEEQLETGLAGDHFVNDERIYGLFPEFLPFVSEGGLRAAAVAARNIDAGTINQIVQSVPVAWGPTQQVRQRWAESIIERGQRLEEYLLDGIVPQRQMDI